jgi:alkylation response protein AidB-like acyl-CoA dehydrogenase
MGVTRATTLPDRPAEPAHRTASNAQHTTGRDRVDLEADLVARAAAVGQTLAASAAGHDRNGTWVDRSFAAVRDAGLLRIAVPTELGGDGATIRQVAMVQRELAAHCGSTALASAMHQHVTAFTAWRYRRGLPGAEATLRRIAADGIVVVSTGGGDFTHPAGSAVRVDGGYRVAGRKSFVSQAPVGSVLSTMFPLDDPERGRRVLNVAVPFATDGVAIDANWDTMGMRGTASHDVIFDDVFVPDERVLADRPYGIIDGPLQVISSIAFPIISAVYLGLAEGAYRHTLDHLSDREPDLSVQRRIGLMRHRLQVAGWALDGALTAVGDDPSPSMASVVAVMAAKREIALVAAEVTGLAMDLGGARTYRKGSPIERAHRDAMAARFHPLDPETTLIHGGRHVLGLPSDTPSSWTYG